MRLVARLGALACVVVGSALAVSGDHGFAGQTSRDVVLHFPGDWECNEYLAATTTLPSGARRTRVRGQEFAELGYVLKEYFGHWGWESDSFSLGKGEYYLRVGGGQWTTAREICGRLAQDPRKPDENWQVIPTRTGFAVIQALVEPQPLDHEPLTEALYWRKASSRRCMRLARKRRRWLSRWTSAWKPGRPWPIGSRACSTSRRTTVEL